MKATKKTKVGGGRVALPAPAGTYKCPKCANIIEVFVAMSMAPACLKHAMGPIAMEVIK